MFKDKSHKAKGKALENNLLERSEDSAYLELLYSE